MSILQNAQQLTTTIGHCPAFEAVPASQFFDTSPFALFGPAENPAVPRISVNVVWNGGL